MALSYMKRRGAVFYVQMAVPTDLQAVLGRKTMDQSLKTKDPAEARRLLPDVLNAWHRLFDETRARKQLTPEHRKAAT